MSFRSSRGLFAYAVFTALATLGLICMGGLVTSKGVGMAVPDWPTSFGYNMFALPVNQWFHGGVFDEHTHRLWASTVGVLVVFLVRFLGGVESRRPLAWIGAVEVALGASLLAVGPSWKGAGHFLMGIGGVVLLAALTGFRGQRAAAPLPTLGWLSFWAVQIQGLLGGLRVVLDQWVVGDLTLGLILGLVHGCLGQGFFVLLGVIAFCLSPLWESISLSRPSGPGAGVPFWFGLGCGLVVLQLILGASMRHQHAGLAIPDFPTAYGRWWPDVDSESLVRYNQNRVDESSVTAFQILLQMAHRIGALAVVVSVGMSLGSARSRYGAASPVGRLAAVWLAIVLAQFALGASILWTHKAADVATAHVALGAAALLTGTLLILVARKLSLPECGTAPVGVVPVFAARSAR
ncbi:MAG: COX15/CtaA family protein [Verrucomicrobiales bacterium]|nr:COX15/CtaA family protein [Verrucomicrobiales bacterium]